jgi:hypothetical protein
VLEEWENNTPQRRADARLPVIDDQGAFDADRDSLAIDGKLPHSGGRQGKWNGGRNDDLDGLDKRGQVVVDAEDALIATLKVKIQRPEA